MIAGNDQVGLLIFIGGGLGSLARYGVGQVSAKYTALSFPLGTLISNTVACVLLAFLVYSFLPKNPTYTWIQPLLIIGFCGGFSTFSTFISETDQILKSGNMLLAFGNIILDIVFIKFLDMGMFGAALATTISYFMCFVFILWFFVKKSELKPSLHHYKLDLSLVKEISSLGLVTFSRQGVVSILAIIINHTLFTYGGEHSVVVYGIISRMLMFALFPILGITHGFLPIAGYNYGAENYNRVKETISISIKYAAVLATFIFIGILIFAKPIVSVFTNDVDVIAETPDALRWVFAATPIIALQLIGAAYFQAAGKAIPALLLTLSKQGFFLIPLVLILPNYFGIFGVWVAFPIADVLSTIVTAYFLRREMTTKLIEKTDGIL